MSTETTLNKTASKAVEESKAALRQSLLSWKFIYKDDLRKYQEHAAILIENHRTSMMKSGVPSVLAEAAIEQVQVEIKDKRFPC